MRSAAAHSSRPDGLQYIIDDCQRQNKPSDRLTLIRNFENIEHLPHPDFFLAAAATQLTPAAAMLTFQRRIPRATQAFVDGKPANPFHVHEWYGPGVRKLLEATFEDVDMRVQVRSIALQSRAKAVGTLRGALAL